MLSALLCHARKLSERCPCSCFSRKRYATVVLLTWIPTSLLVSFAYRSTLLASLVATEREGSVDTFQEVLDHGMTLVLAEGYAPHDFMVDSRREVVRRAYQECAVDRKGLYEGDWGIR